MTVGVNAYSYQVSYENEVMNHSGVGIASFVMSIAVGVFDFAVIVLAGFVEASTPGGMDEESVVAVLIGLAIFAGMFANLAGIGLGVAGLVQRGRKKVFAALGLAFNSLAILGIVFLMILGSMMPA
jgi:hypothetical protein